MISYDFEYFRPKTYNEALNIFEVKMAEGKKPLYYGGGTEIVTFARKKAITTAAVIDIKDIEESTEFVEDENTIVYGAGLSLNEIIEKTDYKLMSDVARKIADHTVRNRLTLGGNICGRLFYKEAILPLLLADARVVIASKEGIKRLAIGEVFDKRMKLKNEEVLLQVEIHKDYCKLPYFHERKEKQGEIDYPLFHLAALKFDGFIRFAFSGILAYPFRSARIEEILNDKSMSMEERADHVIENLPANIRDDIYASADFREYLFRNSIVNALQELEGDK